MKFRGEWFAGPSEVDTFFAAAMPSTCRFRMFFRPFCVTNNKVCGTGRS